MLALAKKLLSALIALLDNGSDFLVDLGVRFLGVGLGELLLRD